MYNVLDSKSGILTLTSSGLCSHCPPVIVMILPFQQWAYLAVEWGVLAFVRPNAEVILMYQSNTWPTGLGPRTLCLCF